MKLAIVPVALLMTGTMGLSLPKIKTGTFSLNKDRFKAVAAARAVSILNGQPRAIPTGQPVTRRPWFQWQPLQWRPIQWKPLQWRRPSWTPLQWRTRTGEGMRAQIPYQGESQPDYRQQDPAKCPAPDRLGIDRDLNSIVPPTDQQLLSDAVWDSNDYDVTKDEGRNYYSCGVGKAGVCAVVWDFEKCTWMYRQVGTTTTPAPPTTTTTRRPTTRRTTRATTTTTAAPIPMPEGGFFRIAPVAPGVQRTVMRTGQRLPMPAIPSRQVIVPKPEAMPEMNARQYMPVIPSRPVSVPKPESKPQMYAPKYLPAPESN